MNLPFPGANEPSNPSPVARSPQGQTSPGGGDAGQRGGREALRPGRFPLVELSIVLAIGLIGWAAYRLWESEPEISTDSREAAALRLGFQRAQELYRKSGESPEQARRESDLFWQEALHLASEYHSIADRLQKSTNFLQNFISPQTLRGGGDPARRKERLDTLETWLQRLKQRVDVESLDNRTKALQGQMARIETNSPATIKDLGTLIKEVDEAYDDYRSNYLALVAGGKTETKNPGLTGTPPTLAASRGAASDAVGQLGRLADQADQYDRAIQLFLKARTGSDINFQRQVLQPLFDAVSAADFARRGGHELALTKPGPHSVHQAVWVLGIALAALAALLGFDLYRRGVVLPLQLKLAQRETYLEQQKKLERLEEVAAGLAHEIRNPLTTISARLHMIRRRLEDDAAEDKNALVIMREIERVNQILGEFIQLTRPATPKLEVMSAGPLLEEIGEFLRPELERQGLKLKLECDLNGQGRFYADAQQLKQVLINLVQNAADSMHGQGSVTLRAQAARMNLKGRPDNVTVIEVEDTGPGIPPGVRQHLFEPFFSTKKGGTGLGLPISARIIDRHGGELDFDTEIGRGTVFRIVLPAYDRG
jgi:signal transduction histidine kinase